MIYNLYGERQVGQMIKLDNVSKYYVGNNEVALGLRKINLEFTVGEMVAITGESGSGKSTLLNVLSGSDTYEEGELYIDGRPTSYYDETDWEKYRRENIGFIYQSYNLIDSYTVYENVNIALVIKGETGDNKGKVMEYLNKVGLGEHAGKKATQLSSGQKQRLSIARALAKETDIIVADEPTGNLDSENSAEIMKILHNIAEDKLIFVVTHNYDEIEPYATRKIRMYDGEVAEDIILRPKRLSGASENTVEDNMKMSLTEKKISLKEGAGTAGNKEKNKKDNKEEKEDRKEDRKEEKQADRKEEKEVKRKIVNKIDRLNRKNKPLTFVFLLSFMVAVAASFYILLGSFFSNLDNTTSKVFDSKKFDNKDINRIIVMKEDGSAFEDSDVEEIENIGRVDCVDKYDCMSETFYLLNENEDYSFYYHKKTRNTEEPSYTQPRTITGDKYMKSVTCIDESDLAAGTMPKDIYDIAVYSEDESLLGSTIRMYLGNRLLWGTDLAEVECTVTAILKEETEQIYFSEQMGEMLEADPNKYIDYIIQNDEGFELGGTYNKVVVQVQPVEPPVNDPSILETELDEENYEEEEEKYVNNTRLDIATRPIFMVNKMLTGNEAIVSDKFRASVYTTSDAGIVYPYDFYNIVSFGIINNKYNNDIEVAEIILENASEAVEHVKKHPEWFGSSEDEYEQELNYVQAEYEKALEDYNSLARLRHTHRSALVLQQDTSLSTINVIQVSEEFFQQEIGYRQSTQMAVYIDDYAYADNVMNTLKSKGYVAASVYRIGAVEYDWNLVERKATSMFVSLGAFVVIFLVGVFILGMIMNLGARDFKILRLLGIERNDLNSINKVSIIKNMVIAVVISFIIIFALNLFNVTYIVNIVKYYRWYFYLIYFTFIVLFCLLLYVRSRARVKKMSRM